MLVKNEIWKYRIEHDNATTEVTMPKGAKVLSVMDQNNSLVVYALVNTLEQETETKIFASVGTGREVKVNTSVYKFLGTATTHQGRYVFHVFYI